MLLLLFEGVFECDSGCESLLRSAELLSLLVSLVCSSSSLRSPPSDVHRGLAAAVLLICLQQALLHDKVALKER